MNPSAFPTAPTAPATGKREPEAETKQPRSVSHHNNHLQGGIFNWPTGGKIGWPLTSQRPTWDMPRPTADSQRPTWDHGPYSILLTSGSYGCKLVDTRPKLARSSTLAAVGGMDVLDSTSDPYRCGS